MPESDNKANPPLSSHPPRSAWKCILASASSSAQEETRRKTENAVWNACREAAEAGRNSVRILGRSREIARLLEAKGLSFALLSPSRDAPEGEIEISW